MHMLQSFFYLTTSLYVSGVTITHLQEHKTTLTTASGNRYTVIDRVKFLLLQSTDRLDYNLTFMEPCIVVWLVAITNEMQLSKGIYYSTVH